jgi:hypothetical protein
MRPIFIDVLTIITDNDTLSIQFGGFENYVWLNLGSSLVGSKFPIR